jgi:branched-chain amino acid transport system substrate-binding protein
LATIAIASLTLAGCTPAVYECTDTIGCVDIAPGQPIHIAYALIVSGSNATLGIDSGNGAELAISEAGGELFGHPIQFDGEDDRCSAEGGQSAGLRLAADPTIVAVLGPSCSSAIQAAVPLLSRAGYTIISPSTASMDLTQARNENTWPGFHQLAPSDFVQGATSAKFAWEILGVKKAATIQDGSLEAEQRQQAFAEEFTRLGGEIMAKESIDPTQTDMSPVLISISTKEPDLIYLPIFIQPGSQIIKQVMETPGLENVYLIGADSLFSPDVMERTGETGVGLFISSPDNKTFDESYQTQFIPMYEGLFGSEPISIFHAYSYDAMNLILAAIRQVAVMDPDGSLHIGRQALRDTIYEIKDVKGLTGTLTCTPAGNCVDAQIAIYKYQNGIYPPDRVWP